MFRVIVNLLPCELSHRGHGFQSWKYILCILAACRDKTWYIYPCQTLLDGSLVHLPPFLIVNLLINSLINFFPLSKRQYFVMNYYLISIVIILVQYQLLYWKIVTERGSKIFIANFVNIRWYSSMCGSFISERWKYRCAEYCRFLFLKFRAA